MPVLLEIVIVRVVAAVDDNGGVDFVLFVFFLSLVFVATDGKWLLSLLSGRSSGRDRGCSFVYRSET